MKYFRYMSEKELMLLLEGKDLYNFKAHRKECKSTSVGFCFLSEQTLFNDSHGMEHSFSPCDCLEFLYGIVSKDLILVEFDSKYELEESSGIYADPFGSWGDGIEIKEYCTRHYNRDSMNPVNVTYIHEV